MEKVPAKSILQKAGPNNMKWFGIDYNMNLYKGCCHGCIYCDSRSNCYGIERFDEVRLKENCLEILEQELRKKKKTGVVGIGAMSDTYNPFEKKYEITRGALKLIARYGFGVALDTKSSLVVRDVDILKEISQNEPVLAKITITAADDELAGKIEPNVSSSSERFRAVTALSSSGIYTGILFTPMLPFITDTEENVREMVKKAHDAGAKFIYGMFGVTLRENQRDYYYKQLDKLFPGLKSKYMKAYGGQYVCSVADYERLGYIFKEECSKYNLLYKMKDIIEDYKKDYMIEQIKFNF